MPDSTEPRHILTRFDQALNELRASLLRMASLAEQNFSMSARALATRDENLCNRVIAEDEEVDTLEKTIDAEGISIITRFQPVAHDFRRVFSTMKAATDLERVADQAVSIARRTKRLIQNLELPETRMLEPMFASASSLLRDSIRALAEEDQELGSSLKPRDKMLDKMQHEFIDRITRRMEEDATNAQGYLDLVLIARVIERVGDHAVNIGEDSVYAGSARDIRHQQQAESV
jgi:phosphate transport system protein